MMYTSAAFVLWTNQSAALSATFSASGRMNDKGVMEGGRQDRGREQWRQGVDILADHITANDLCLAYTVMFNLNVVI